ncbi:MAG: hypothetical protein PHS17_19780, partial [Desulfobacterales bacterium]|nr:hypothetical protein [Desulfobacterales bacterium]
MVEERDLAQQPFLGEIRPTISERIHDCGPQSLSNFGSIGVSYRIVGVKNKLYDKQGQEKDDQCYRQHTST